MLSGFSLETLYPLLLHVTCAAHGIQRVIKKVRSNNKVANQFVSNIKKFLSRILGVNDCTLISQIYHYPGVLTYINNH